MVRDLITMKSQCSKLLIIWIPTFSFVSIAKILLLSSFLLFILNAILSFYSNTSTAINLATLNSSSPSPSFVNSVFPISILPPSLPPPLPLNPTSSSNSINSSAAAYTDPHRLQTTLSAKQNSSLQSRFCDLSKGEWVEDRFAPYYSNTTCWTIQEHQNCMKYGRPDKDFLKWRWKPDGCELPLLDPVKFLEFMRSKNLAFAGDSLARNQMQSLMCLLSRVEYPKEATSSENLTQMVYPKHNFTIWIFWSPFLVRADQLNRSGGKFPAWNLYLDEPDPLWLPHIPNFDYLILNTGNWFTRPALFHLNGALAGCHYCPVPEAPFLSIRRANGRAFRTALAAVINASRQGFRGMTIVRTVSPAHFEGGPWNDGGDCVRTRPFRRWEAPRLEEVELGMHKEQMKEFWKAKWEGRRRGVEFRLLDATEALLMRPDGHPGRYGHWPNENSGGHNDCVHWCLPGPVDMWNDFLFRIITTI